MKELLELLRRSLCEEKIEFALIFGSFANTSMHALSDIDIGVSFKEKPDLLKTSEIVDELETKIKRDIDLVILNGIYTKNPLLAYEITINHKPICILNHEAYVEFQTKSYLYYFDLKPLYELQLEAFKKRIECGDIAKVTQTRTKS